MRTPSIQTPQRQRQKKKKSGNFLASGMEIFEWQYEIESEKLEATTTEKNRRYIHVCTLHSAQH